MRFVAALLLWCVSQGALATAVTTDYTDLWINPPEAGWGVNLAQQDDVIFATMFVYGQANQPTWFLGSALTYQGVVNGALTFTGAWYQTTGPYFGAGAFNSSAVAYRQVGTATLSLPFISSGTFTYTVDGVTVTKPIERLGWKAENIAGRFLGATIGTASLCNSPGINGPFENHAEYTVTTAPGFAVTIAEKGVNSIVNCTYNGTYTQQGRMGEVRGAGFCNNGETLTFVASEIQVGVGYLFGRLSVQSNLCFYEGHFGGPRRN
jgi:hypothetical protein